MNLNFVFVIQSDPPVVSAITPQQVTWVGTTSENIWVSFEGGFPDPEITWVRQLVGSARHEIITNNETGFIFSGMHLLNLTVMNVTLDDAGNYSVTALNSLGKSSLWFHVDVIGICVNLIAILSIPIIKVHACMFVCLM